MGAKRHNHVEGSLSEVFADGAWLIAAKCVHSVQSTSTRSYALPCRACLTELQYDFEGGARTRQRINNTKSSHDPSSSDP